jgi:hypothetical protein
MRRFVVKHFHADRIAGDGKDKAMCGRPGALRHDGLRFRRKAL